MYKVLDCLIFYFAGMFGKKTGRFNRKVEDTYDEYEDEYEKEKEEQEDGIREREMNGEQEDLAVDLVDKGRVFEVRTFIAGTDIEDIEISVTRETLTVRAEVKDECGYEESSYMYRELFYGVVERSILIPEEVDVDSVEAEMKEGVLVIKLPKLDKKQQKKVNIKKK